MMQENDLKLESLDTNEQDTDDLCSKVVNEILEDKDIDSNQADTNIDISEENIILKQLEEKVEEYKNNLLRERAEFINYRKRVSEEKRQLEDSAISKFLISMLPILDAFDHTFQSTEEFENQVDPNKATKLDSFLQGVKLIQKQLVQVFTDYGVVGYSPEGDKFDPTLMEALHIQDSDETDYEIVQSVYQKGYRIKEKVLRPARVVVLQPTSSHGDNTEEDKQNIVDSTSE